MITGLLYIGGQVLSTISSFYRLWESLLGKYQLVVSAIEIVRIRCWEHKPRARGFNRASVDRQISKLERLKREH
jgi:hypothetical protein